MVLIMLMAAQAARGSRKGQKLVVFEAQICDESYSDKARQDRDRQTARGKEEARAAGAYQEKGSRGIASTHNVERGAQAKH